MFDAVGADLLLVEGEAVLAELTSFRLELLGFHLRVVDSTLLAQRAIDEQRPQLVIIDSVGQWHQNGRPAHHSQL